MSPPTAVDRPSTHPASPARRGVPTRALLVVAAVVLVLAAVSLVPTERFVSRITYANSSPYDFHVDVATTPTGGWMDAGEAFRSTHSDAEQIYDIGDAWWFRYSAQGRTSRPYRLTRDQLERSGWTVTVPESVARDFEARSVPVQP